MSSKTIFVFLMILSFVYSCGTNSQDKSEEYLKEKKQFHSNLFKKGKAPQDYEQLENSDEILKVEYTSDGKQLLAILLKKSIDSTKRKPVLVYLHGGFSLGREDLADCEIFTEKGFIVFAPTYRGENGNDGNFELFLGEVEDAKESIKWLAKQPFVDSTRVYVFGHSIGGGISSMLSLEKDVPIAKSGSSGGLYDKEFYGWDDIIPFDKRNPNEGKMRVLIENLNSMQMNHYAFIGIQDEPLFLRKEEMDRKAKNTKLKIFYIPGDHFSSLEPAMEKFIDIINNKEK